MRLSTDSENLTVIDDATSCDVSARSDIPSIILGHGFAGNDATCDDPAISADDAEPCAWHALAANHVGNAGATDTVSSARPTSHELHQVARAHRSFTLGKLIAAEIQAIAAFIRRAHARHQQRRHAAAIADAFSQLDDHTLRDLGFDRGEITSVAAELAGGAERTRVRALLM